MVHQGCRAGDADAQQALGVCYAYGLGVAKNLIEGYAWYNIAIANGNEYAKENIKEIELSPEQLIEASSINGNLQADRGKQTRLTLLRLETNNVIVKPLVYGADNDARGCSASRSLSSDHLFKSAKMTDLNCLSASVWLIEQGLLDPIQGRNLAR